MSMNNQQIDPRIVSAAIDKRIAEVRVGSPEFVRQEAERYLKMIMTVQPDHLAKTLAGQLNDSQRQEVIIYWLENMRP